MSASTEQATFAAGCFWGVEHYFRGVPGVLETKVGYTGGHKDNPTYQEVCSDTTGHAEAVLITFDPGAVSYETLLGHFWKMHDPTQLNRQGPDFGKQYRTAIFTHSEDQAQAAKASKESAQSGFSKPIVTEIDAASEFWPAEEYHQCYFEKKGMEPTCHP